MNIWYLSIYILFLIDQFHGVANIISSIAFGFPSQLVIENTLFNTLSGATGIWSGLILILIMGSILYIYINQIIALLFYSNLFLIVGYIPRFVLAGSLIYITLEFFKESLWDAFFQFSLLDYFVILIILFCSAVSDISSFFLSFY